MALKMKKNAGTVNKKLIIIVLSFMFLGGCGATKLAHHPEEYTDISKSIKVLKEGFLHQSPSFRVKTVDVTPTYIKVLDARGTTSYIHFENIGKIDLHEKGKWKIVSIYGKNNRERVYRLYVANIGIAKNFINAVYTLKNNHRNISMEPANQEQIRVPSEIADFTNQVLSGFGFCKKTIVLNSTNTPHACIDRVKRDVEQRFNLAIKTWKNNPNAVESLNLFHSYSLKSLDSLVRHNSEPSSVYLNRLAELEIDLQSRRNKLNTDAIRFSISTDPIQKDSLSMSKNNDALKDGLDNPKPENKYSISDLDEVSDQLKLLKKLNDSQILTDEEYEAKRKALVNKI